MPEMVSDRGPEGLRHVESRPFRPFKTSEEYLYAMKEDLAEWLNTLYELDMTAEVFMEKLDTGIVLCNHANQVRVCSEQFEADHVMRHGRRFSPGFRVPGWEVHYNRQARPGSFFSRDNIHNFIRWCNELGVLDCLMFETEDLVSRKNEKHVILCLLEIARRGAKFGMAAPMLVQFEQQIDREIARDEAGGDGGLRDHEPPAIMVYGPSQQVVTNDLKSLDEMVRDLVARCTCPSQFPMIRVSEGKYRIGDSKTLIFVRILRNHVMVRVGGGWDTLQHYLDKHDPCRCKAGHRATVSSKLFMKSSPGEGDRQLSGVTYERSGDADGGSPARQPARNRSPSAKRPSLLQSEGRPHDDGSAESGYEPSDDDPRSPGDTPTGPPGWSPSASDYVERVAPLRSPTTPTGRSAGATPPSGKAAKTRHPLIASALRGLKNLRPAKAGGGVTSPSGGGLLAPPEETPGRRLSVDSGRSSMRVSRSSQGRASRSGQHTWSGGQRARERPALSADTFRRPGAGGGGPGRATSASPGPRRRASQQPATMGRPRQGGILDRLMDAPDLDDDDKVLQRMEELLRQYRPHLEPAAAEAEMAPLSPRVTPRKESQGAAKTRIPAPTFFQPRVASEQLP